MRRLFWGEKMYRSETLFPYADGYYAIFPRGLEDRDVGEGSIVIEDEYIIYFKKGTPEDIKERFIQDYARYYARKKELGWY